MGLHCITQDDNISGDEPFVITTVIPRFGDGITEKSPFGVRSYVDVDSGNIRVGPARDIWRGEATDLSVLVVVMEHDTDDPEVYANIIRVSASLAGAIAGHFLPGSELIWAIAGELVGEIVISVLDFGDDKVGQASY